MTFVLGHDGNLWLETGPFGDVARTIQTRQPVDIAVVAFQALPTLEVYLIDGSQNLWFEWSPYGPANRQIVDQSVDACYPLFSEQLIGG